VKPHPVILFIDGKKAQTARWKVPLEQHGYPVLTARKGQEGLELVKSREIGLVVVDTSISDR
jgi:DNA-binding response OmpR family regulator